MSHTKDKGGFPEWATDGKAADYKFWICWTDKDIVVPKKEVAFKTRQIR